MIGAGVAGLSAANILAEEGCDVTVFEARDHAGGRATTVRFRRTTIELGAEFIHGRKNQTWKLFKNLRAFKKPSEFPDRHWLFVDGQLRENKFFWQDLSRVLERTREQKKDRTFCGFLRDAPELPGNLRAIALDYVEGFHAADPGQVSVKSLEEAEESAEETEGEKQFRPRRGYGEIIEEFVGRLRSRGVQFKFSTEVQRVEWKKYRVIIQSGDAYFSVDRALITVPLGVLKAKISERGAIRFDPPLSAKQRILKKLRMGNVCKVTLLFKERFWPRKLFGFVHAHGQPFPTLWMNRNTPAVVAWAGGPEADALARFPGPTIVRRAVSEVAHIFGVSVQAVRALLIEAFFHDWRTDPYSRGAYTYTPVESGAAVHRAGLPARYTLFFAGELYAPPGEQGTVHGAIASGQAAAEMILKSKNELKNRRRS